MSVAPNAGDKTHVRSARNASGCSGGRSQHRFTTAFGNRPRFPPMLGPGLLCRGDDKCIGIIVNRNEETFGAARASATSKTAVTCACYVSISRADAWLSTSHRGTAFAYHWSSCSRLARRRHRAVGPTISDLVPPAHRARMSAGHERSLRRPRLRGFAGSVQRHCHLFVVAKRLSGRRSFDVVKSASADVVLQIYVLINP